MELIQYILGFLKWQPGFQVGTRQDIHQIVSATAQVLPVLLNTFQNRLHDQVNSPIQRHLQYTPYHNPVWFRFVRKLVESLNPCLFSNCVGSQASMGVVAGLGFHGIRSRSAALRMSSSLSMAATIITFLETQTSVEAVNGGGIVAWFLRHWQMEETFQAVRALLGGETQHRWSSPAIARPHASPAGTVQLVTVIATGIRRCPPPWPADRLDAMDSLVQGPAKTSPISERCSLQAGCLRAAECA